MKTKSRGSILYTSVPGGNQHYNLDKNGNWIPGQTDSWMCSIPNGFIETISYDDTKRTGKLFRSRWCDHTKCMMAQHWSSVEAYTNSSKTQKCVQNTGGFGSTSPLPLPTSLSSVHAEALAFFESGCQERELDLAVNLIEWEQTLNLFRRLLPLLKGFKYFLNSADKKTFLRRLSLKLKTDVKKLTLKDLADAHLSYEFGIKPLLQDIEGFYKYLMSMEEKFAWLRKNQGKPIKVRFSKDLSTSYAPSGPWENYTWHKNRTFARHYECRYFAHALIVYDVQKLNDAELALRLFARANGVDSALRNLWELVPFSFAIDWILDVGTWIESFDPRVTLPYKFLDSCWSLRITEHLVRIEEFVYPKSQSLRSYGYANRSRFYREPGIPTSFSSISTGSPGLKQLALAMSLSVQKFHR